MSRAVEVPILCPCCGHEITVTFLRGEEPITYGPPERCHPGSPDEWEDPRGCECACYLTGDLARRYEDDVMEAIMSAPLAGQDHD